MCLKGVYHREFLLNTKNIYFYGKIMKVLFYFAYFVIALIKTIKDPRTYRELALNVGVYIMFCLLLPKGYNTEKSICIMSVFIFTVLSYYQVNKKSITIKDIYKSNTSASFQR